MNEWAICPRCLRPKRGIHTCNPASERVQAYVACLESAKRLFLEMSEDERRLVEAYTVSNLAMGTQSKKGGG